MVIQFFLGGTMMTREQIVREYDTLLRSYARFCEVSRDCLLMTHVENALVTLAVQNVDAQPVHMVALAGVAGALAGLELSFRANPTPHVEFRCKRWNETKVAAAHRAAVWLCRQTPGCVWFFCVPRRYVEKHKRELVVLVDQCFPPRCMEAYKRELLEIFEQYESSRQLGKASNIVTDDCT